jgi:hypothetical protein|tara:strand:+ start:690 stop:818 length:129 start_codon:yes stop_codon:yes gene_type:complete
MQKKHGYETKKSTLGDKEQKRREKVNFQFSRLKKPKFKGQGF